jgi:hypothetical protein
MTGREAIPKRSLTGRCVIFDMDETLVHTDDTGEELRNQIVHDPRLMPLRRRLYNLRADLSERKGDGKIAGFWGIQRPHLKEFLIFCFSYFRVVAIWSAGVRPYVEGVIDEIFRDLPQPHLIYARENCDMIDGIFTKPIVKMMDDPVVKGIMHEDNTFIVDDRRTSLMLNPTNGILIPPFSPPPTLEGLSTEDIAFLQFKYWLLLPKVKEAADVRTLGTDKGGIFERSLNDYLKALGSNPSYSFS